MLKLLKNQESVPKYFHQRYPSSYKRSTKTNSYFQRIPSAYHLHRWWWWIQECVSQLFGRYKSKNEEGFSKINHEVFSPSTGTKRRLGVVERFKRTLREKYVFYVKKNWKLQMHLWKTTSLMLYQSSWKITITQIAI